MSTPNFRAVMVVAGLAVLAALILFSGDDPEPQPEPQAAVSEPAEPEKPDSSAGCRLLEASDFTVRTAQPTRDSVVARTGPGTDYPLHESGWIYRSEPVRVLQDCNGWVQGAVIAPNQVGRVKAQQGRARAIEMLTFWLPASQLTGNELPAYRVLDRVDQLSGRPFGDVLVPSFSQETPPAIRRDILKRIIEEEGLQDASLYCSVDAQRADYSRSYSESHPDALARCALGAWQNGRFSSYD